jgi:hypothetical protein
MGRERNSSGLFLPMTNPGKSCNPRPRTRADKLALMAASTVMPGPCIPGLAGVSDLSRCASDPAVFDGWKEMIWSGEVEDRGDPEDSRGLGVFCTEAAF